jgi:hypothetical protein
MRKFMCAMTALVSLSACERSWVELPQQVIPVRIVEVDPPKRLRVTVMDLRNGATYGPVYVAKRCSSYQRVPVGTEVALRFKVWENINTHEISVEPNVADLRIMFCG